MKIFISMLLLSFLSTDSIAQEITGDWYGVLSVEGKELGIVFHITETEEGYSTTMDSPDQNGFGIPAASTTYEDEVLDIKAPKIGGMHYRGTIKDGILSGSLRQGGMLIPLKLYRENPKEIRDDKPE